MKAQAVVAFHQDSQLHWIAELACGHRQHVRHDPPWQLRPLVSTPEGRAAMLDRTLPCRQCDPIECDTGITASTTDAA